jgi:hypothetical protein
MMRRWILIQRERTGLVILIRSDEWDPPVRSRFYFFPPGETFSGPARSGSVQNRPSLFRIGPFPFYLFSRPFELIQITFRYDFQT